MKGFKPADYPRQEPVGICYPVGKKYMIDFFVGFIETGTIIGRLMFSPWFLLESCALFPRSRQQRDLSISLNEQYVMDAAFIAKYITHDGHAEKSAEASENT